MATPRHFFFLFLTFISILASLVAHMTIEAGRGKERESFSEPSSLSPSPSPLQSQMATPRHFFFFFLFLTFISILASLVASMTVEAGRLKERESLSKFANDDDDDTEKTQVVPKKEESLTAEEALKKQENQQQQLIFLPQTENGTGNRPSRTAMPDDLYFENGNHRSSDRRSGSYYNKEAYVADQGEQAREEQNFGGHTRLQDSSHTIPTGGGFHATNDRNNYYTSGNRYGAAQLEGMSDMRFMAGGEHNDEEDLARCGYSSQWYYVKGNDNDRSTDMRGGSYYNKDAYFADQGKQAREEQNFGGHTWLSSYTITNGGGFRATNYRINYYTSGNRYGAAQREGMSDTRFMAGGEHNDEEDLSRLGYIKGDGNCNVDLGGQQFEDVEGNSNGNVQFQQYNSVHGNNNANVNLSEQRFQKVHGNSNGSVTSRTFAATPTATSTSTSNSTSSSKTFQASVEPPAVQQCPRQQQALEPFFNAAASEFILGQQIPFTLWLSLAPVVLGVSMASLTELSFNWTGFISAMISNI